MAHIGNAQATPFDRLLMPGPLVENHKKYENECEKCHEAFKKARQSKLCLSCHKTINKDVESKLGFHGLNKEVSKEDCKYCHTEHLGRDVDIINLNQHSFDHQVTDFPLKGAHKALVCGGCHQKGKKYRPLEHQCNDCHKNNDIHKTRLGEKCADCHSEKNWKNAKFDHNKTEYKLQNKHVKVACVNCHPNQRYKDTPKICYDCHQLQDIHQLKYSNKCEKCHTTEEWKKILFDHDKDTKFKLIDSHVSLKCSSCHKGDIYKDKTKKECTFCHQSDDKHIGLYGVDCQDCHNQKKWSKVNFKHKKDDKFSLIGAHDKLECIACHKKNIADDKLDSSCILCHKKDDIHKGKQGENCSHCHKQTGWAKDIAFEHDLTSYPLIGLHALASCESCHATTEYKMQNKACINCHASDDEHHSKLGNNCALCHNPNGWRQWKFSHNKDTKYPLDGAHVDLDCLSCHAQKLKDNEKIVLSKVCFSCHVNDDVHSGKFGKYCEKCHKTTKFNDLSILN